PEEWRARTCHDAHGKSVARHDQLSVPTRVALLKLKVHAIGTSEVSRPAEAFATGRDFAKAVPHAPPHYIVSQRSTSRELFTTGAGYAIEEFGAVKRNRGPNVLSARRSTDRALNYSTPPSGPYGSPPKKGRRGLPNAASLNANGPRALADQPLHPATHRAPWLHL